MIMRHTPHLCGIEHEHRLVRFAGPEARNAAAESADAPKDGAEAPKDNKEAKKKAEERKDAADKRVAALGTELDTLNKTLQALKGETTDVTATNEDLGKRGIVVEASDTTDTKVSKVETKIKEIEEEQKKADEVKALADKLVAAHEALTLAQQNASSESADADTVAALKEAEKAVNEAQKALDGADPKKTEAAPGVLDRFTGEMDPEKLEGIMKIAQEEVDKLTKPQRTSDNKYEVASDKMGVAQFEAKLAMIQFKTGVEIKLNEDMLVTLIPPASQLQLFMNKLTGVMAFVKAISDKEEGGKKNVGKVRAENEKKEREGTDKKLNEDLAALQKSPEAFGFELKTESGPDGTKLSFAAARDQELWSSRIADLRKIGFTISEDEKSAFILNPSAEVLVKLGKSLRGPIEDRNDNLMEVVKKSPNWIAYPDGTNPDHKFAFKNGVVAAVTKTGNFSKLDLKTGVWVDQPGKQFNTEKGEFEDITPSDPAKRKFNTDTQKWESLEAKLEARKTEGDKYLRSLGAEVKGDTYVLKDITIQFNADTSLWQYRLNDSAHYGDILNDQHVYTGEDNDAGRKPYEFMNTALDQLEAINKKV